MSVREKSKQQRRDRILEAAATLLRKGGAEALTMRELARCAKVSEMTPYNLFGGKAEIVTALFEARLGTLVSESFREMPSDALERLFVGQEMLTTWWTEDSAFFRELIRAAREAGADLSPFEETPVALLEAGLNDAARAGLIGDEVPRDELARHIFVANQGVHDPWVEGDLDDEELRSGLITGLAIALLAVAKPAPRKRILERMRQARKQGRRGRGGASADG